MIWEVKEKKVLVLFEVGRREEVEVVIFVRQPMDLSFPWSIHFVTICAPLRSKVVNSYCNHVLDSFFMKWKIMC